MQAKLLGYGIRITSMGEVNAAFKIVKVEDKFWIQDEHGHTYGSYNTRAEAEESLEGWRAYYSSPLP